MPTEAPNPQSYRALVEAMRNAQKSYFATRSKDWLHKSKQLEREVDAFWKETQPASESQPPQNLFVHAEHKIKSVDDFTPAIVRQIGGIVGSVLPKGVGFGLVLFDHGEGLREFRYSSNSQRDDMFRCFEEIVAKWKLDNQNNS